MKKLAYIFAIILLITSRALSATYYIDYEAGDDSNAGTTTGAPFQHLPYDARFTGSCTPAAGDNFYFNRGTTYSATSALTTYMFESITSGSAGSPITFGAYGTGTDPIIEGGFAIDESQFALYSGVAGTNAVYRATNSSLGTTGITVISAYEFDSFDTTETNISHAYVSQGSTSGLTAVCTLYQSGTAAGDYVYIRTSDNNTPVGMDIHLFWVQYGFHSTGHTFVFENLRMFGFYKYIIYMSGSGSYNGYNIDVQNCDFGYTEQAIESSYGAVYSANNRFHYCWMDKEISSDSYDEAGGAANVGASDDTDSLFEDTEIIGYENGLTLVEILSSFTMRRCFVMDAVTTETAADSSLREAEHFIRLSGTAVMGDPVYVYRTIFYNASHDLLYDNHCNGLEGDCNADFRLFNCTIYEDRGGNWPERGVLSWGFTTDWPAYCKNNIFVNRIPWQNYNYTPVTIGWTVVDADYNYYVTDNTGDYSAGPIDDGVDRLDYTLSEWQSALSTNSALSSEANSSWEDYSSGVVAALFQSTTYGDTDFLKPKVGGNLINAGVEITTGENETDYDGNAVVGAYDIGAIEDQTPTVLPRFKIGNVFKWVFE